MMWFFASRLFFCNKWHWKPPRPKETFCFVGLVPFYCGWFEEGRKNQFYQNCWLSPKTKISLSVKSVWKFSSFFHLQKTTCLLPYSNVLSRSFPNRICMRNLVQYIVSSSPSLGSKKHLGRFLLRPYYSTELTCPIFFPVWRSLEEEETESQGESLLFHGSSRVQLMTWKQLKGHKQSFKVSDIDKERSLMRDIWLQHYLQ